MYNAAKTERKHKYTFDSDLRRLPVTIVLLFVDLVASFLCLELDYMHTFSLNHPGDPFFQSGRDPGFENHWFRAPVVKQSRMITSHCFLRSVDVGLKLHVSLSLENSVHSNHQNLSSPVSENILILKSSHELSFY